LASGYNLFLISKYGTSVQNQGTEGACTAYGNAHVLGVLGKIKGKSGEYDAQNIWERQGQEPNMDQSIAAAKGMDFDGLRISSATPLDINVDTLKRQLNSGRPVYYGSNVDSSWQNTDSGSVSCEESDGDSGHAYSIMGYDDSRNVFVIKNSWGDSWGDHGYGYLSYDCIGNQGSTEAFDLQLQ
jgi:C1A family cysteine protease